MNTDDFYELLRELKTDKVANRQKAFVKLSAVVSNNQKSLTRIFEENVNDLDLSYDNLFYHAHEGVKLQGLKLGDVEINEGDNRIRYYSMGLHDLFAASMHPSAPTSSIIQSSQLVEAILEVLKHDLLLKHFGNTYLFLLNNMLSEKLSLNLASIQCSDWKALLKSLLKLLILDGPKFKFHTVIECAQKVVIAGCENSYLAFALMNLNVFEQIKTLLCNRTSQNSNKEKQEVLKLAYYCCRDISIDYRFELCRFLEEITGYICSAFLADNHDKYRPELFKLMDLSMIIHVPNLGKLGQTEYIHEKNKWFRSLKSYEELLLNELRHVHTAYDKSPPKINSVTSEFAARFCYYVYWNDEMWQDENEDEQQNAKRRKCAQKLDTIIDRIKAPIEKPTHFNWKWLTVLSEVISNYPECIQNDDIVSILSLLSECQPLIEFKEQIYAFTKCCCILLENEKAFKATANRIVYDRCQSLWMKIADEAARCCSNSNKNLIESHKLLQLLIYYQKYSSSGFIEGVIKIFTSNSTIKCDTTLDTLIILLKNFNMDSLSNGKELTGQILQFSFEKITLAVLKKVIAGNEKPSCRKLAKLAILCCLLKTDVVNYFKNVDVYAAEFYDNIIDLSEHKKYKSYIKTVTRLIRLKSRDELLIESENYHNTKQIKNLENHENDLELKCMTDEDLFCQLMKLTELPERTAIISDQSTIIEIKDYLKDIMANSELMMNLLSELLFMEAANYKKMEHLFVTKRIVLNMQEIERIFAIIIARNIIFDITDTQKITSAINLIFSNQYHLAVGKLIRTYDVKSCLQWIYQQIDREFVEFIDDDAQIHKLNFKSFQTAKIEQKIRYDLITTLCEYFNYEGINAEYVTEVVDDIRFDINNNIDLHTIFKVIEIFGNQANVPENAVTWIWEAGIIQIFMHHKENLYIMSYMIEKLAELRRFSGKLEGATKNYTTIYHSFSKLFGLDESSKRFFSPKLLAKYLSQFKHFHEEHFTLYHEWPVVKKMYEKIYKEFLVSQSFEVKMSAITCFSSIIRSNYENDNSIDEQKVMNQCRKVIYKDFISMYQYQVRENIDQHNDDDANETAANAQLFVALFCANLNYRRMNLFELGKIFINFNLTEQDGLTTSTKILKQLNCKYSKSVINNHDVVDLISKWIEMELSMNTIPWYLIGSASYSDFVNEHYNLMLLAALKTKSEIVDDILSSLELSLNDAFMPIISSCLAYIIPIKSHAVVRYVNNVHVMNEKLNSAFNENKLNILLIQNIPEVVVKILENVVDNQKFLEMSGYQMDFSSEYESIKYNDYEKCMKYICQIFNPPKNQDLMTYLCKNKLSYVQEIFLMQKKNIQGTESKVRKLLAFLHYNILVMSTIDYMKDITIEKGKGIKEYLYREIANFYCYLTVNQDCGLKLSIMAADSLLVYLKYVIPACDSTFKAQLQRIIPQLVAVSKKCVSEKLTAKCFDIMNFLVLDQSKLKVEISNLDRFPSRPDFDELRNKQLAIKYSDGDFTLIEEIEHFLEVDTRRVEGLTALCEHLSNKKSELQYLFDELNTMISSKDNSTLHRLIKTLIIYTRENNDEERAIEAIRCLGEIGCHNISTTIFNMDESDSTYRIFSSILQCQEFICNKILEKLESLLIHPNVKIFQYASDACYYALRSASSVDFNPSPIYNPFLPGESRSDEQLFYLKPKNQKQLNLHQFIVDNNFMDYPKFIKELCVIMSEYAGDKVFIHLIQSQLQFAEIIFPLIFHLLLLYNNDVVNNEIAKALCYYFEQCFEKLIYSEHTYEGSVFINKKIIRQMLKLIEKIRIYCQANVESPQFIQNFNYLHIAKAAKHCEASFTAIQYCEMWARKQNEANNVEFSESIMDRTLQDVMYRAYSAIGIKEASDVFLNPTTNRAEYLLNNGMHYESLFEISREASNENYMKLLKDAGLYNILSKFNENLESSKKIQDYECLWRLSNWDTIVETDVEIKDDKGLVDYQMEFEKYHYVSLQFCRNNDEVGLKNALYKSRKMIMQLITHHIFECSNTLYKFMEMSHRSSQIEDFSQVLFKRSTNTHDLMLNKWNIHDDLPFDYGHCKKVFLQRNSILSTANIKAGKRTWVPDAVQLNSLFVIKQSVLAGQHNDAVGLITQLRDKITSLPRKFELLLEEAKLNVNRNEEMAKNCLNQIMGNSQIKDGDLIIQSTAYRLYGEMLAEKFSLNVAEIYGKYFQKSIKYLEKYANFHGKEYLIPNLDNEEELSQFSQSLLKEDKDSLINVKIQQASCIYDTIAKYYDREYEFKSSYISSPAFIQKKNTYLKNSERIRTYPQNTTKNNEDSRRALYILQKSTFIDKNDIENAEKEKKNAARNAIYYYLRSTIYSLDDNILNVFRIVSLMLANFSKFIHDFLNENLLKIPSYKFVIALPQLTVRLNDQKTDPLNCLLKKLLTRCALDHPHHTLPLILALVNSYTDSTNENGDEPRVIGAKDLWNSLKKQAELKQIMLEMEQMSSGLINLANLPLKTQEIPAEHKVMKLKKLKSVQCPTIELPVVKNGDYKKSIITVEKWDSKAKSVGGINAPKRIEVLCSDGITRPQLLKGKDDMRQDAIMQQIFGVVNKLLLLDKNMQKNNARIRTYKVVPFSRRSGILQWCENTIPIGIFLAGERTPTGKLVKKGAHEIYRPNDWTPGQCVKKIGSLSEMQKLEDKIEKFNEILDNIKPVFHHFFYERFKNTGEHFERRLTYTMSVAVSSMIGYILGIGDRHVQNILIDLKTAELIHIDFGVAFEQGKILPHPELIPFRLTRDIIAPFGVSGVDGIFRKACEHTMQLLRQNEKTLTTILEVLLYDPMYMWSYGAEQARRSQLECDDNVDCDPSDAVEHDLMAKRALNTVKMKLKGMAENSSVRYPSIDGQIQYLIQTATNPALLCRLFRGWQAYL